MKKRFLLLLLILMCMTLSACKHEHKFKPATCEKPMTCKWCKYEEGKPLGHDIVGATCTEEGICSRCNKPVGGPLGHNFLQATCQAPSTCSRCGETRGEKIDHFYKPANFQHGEVCTMCNDEKGKKLSADFETKNIVCSASFGEVYDYPTRTLENEKKETTPTVSFKDFEVLSETPIPTDGTVLTDAGPLYVWTKTTAEIVSTDLNGATYAVTYLYVNEDYYDIVGHDGSLSMDDMGVFHYTVNFDGTDYTDCRFYADKKDEWVVGEGGTTMVYFYTCVPKGYDGTVLGFLDARTEWDDAAHIDDVYDEKSILLRLPAALAK